ncbi:N-acetylglucosamine kinase [Sphingomonas kyungheensis]|uniref:BadF/BadG/BcrA/BcrD ATPase family protein n=1 Tax=Sphingomonas kyungheensis TaxID=1069987 RepID=A0ABU8H7M4_9SPHN
MTVYLGVDGGGTKTEFVGIDEHGDVLARALTGTTYHLEVGLEEVLVRIAQGVGSICSTLGIEAGALGYVFLGLPAFGEDARVDPLLVASVLPVLGHGRYRCDNDMVCGWAGSLACADGINLVAGTGSIAYGERQGHGARVGGWGEMFSDEGSAYWIAIQGLQAFTRMSDGRQQRGPLHRIVSNALSLDGDLAICARVMGENGMTRGEIAALAPLVSEAADAGDPAAAAILDRAGTELADIAHALRRKLEFRDDERTALSWSGGVLTKQAAVRAALLRDLEARDLFDVVMPRHDPGVGAALYARLLASRNC